MNSIRKLESDIHLAARNVLGLELRSPYILRIANSHEEMANECIQTLNTIFPNDKHDYQSYLQFCKIDRGVWMKNCPGEAVININTVNIDESLKGVGALQVAVIHEIGHIYVVGGSLIDDNESECRSGLLGTRDAPPSWLTKGMRLRQWNEEIRSSYMPNPLLENLNEAITHVVTMLLVYEIAETLSVAQSVELLNGFNAYDTFLENTSQDYTEASKGDIATKKLISTMLRNPKRRREYGQSLAKKIVQLFNQNQSFKKRDGDWKLGKEINSELIAFAQGGK